jgi:hypothetical protein
MPRSVQNRESRRFRGSITTTNAADLLLGVSEFSATGPGYTERLDSLDYNLIVEDTTVTGTGSYSASVYVSPNGEYVTQIAAFKIASGDTTPPTAPTSLTATASSGSQISTDNIGVTGYEVQRCQGACRTTFAQIGTSTVTTYSDTGLATSAAYSSIDTAGNPGGYSSVVNATTPATGGGGGSGAQPPTAPTSLAASSASGAAITLIWGASTDNVGVTEYLIESCPGAGCTAFSQITSVSASPYTVSGLAASTGYTFRTRASDAAGNLSAYSNTASATTGVGGSICD